MHEQTAILHVCIFIYNVAYNRSKLLVIFPNVLIFLTVLISNNMYKEA